MFPKILSFFAILFVFAVPMISLSAPLVPCDGITVKCDFDALMKLVKNLMDFVLLLAMPLAAILFAYAGWLYLSSSVDPGKKGQAHKIFASVFWGLLFTLGAWFIVKLISDALLENAYKATGL